MVKTLLIGLGGFIGAILIEIVDTRHKLEHFLESIKDDMKGGLATLEKANVHYYRSKKKR